MKSVAPWVVSWYRSSVFFRVTVSNLDRLSLCWRHSPRLIQVESLLDDADLSVVLSREKFEGLNDELFTRYVVACLRLFHVLWIDARMTCCQKSHGKTESSLSAVRRRRRAHDALR